MFSGEQKRKPGICLQKKPDPVQTEELHLISDSPGIADVLDPILHSPQVRSSTDCLCAERIISPKNNSKNKTRKMSFSFLEL